MDLAEIKATAEKARSFEHERGDAHFFLQIPPIAEAGEAIFQSIRAADAVEARKRSLDIILDCLRGWAGVTVGLITLENDSRPLDFSRESCLLLFAERPDVMKDLADAIAAFVMARVKFFEDERKNFASTSSP